MDRTTHYAAQFNHKSKRQFYASQFTTNYSEIKQIYLKLLEPVLQNPTFKVKTGDSLKSDIPCRPSVCLQIGYANCIVPPHRI